MRRERVARWNARGSLYTRQSQAISTIPDSATLARELNFVTTETAMELKLPLGHVLVAYYVARLCVDLKAK